MKWTKFLDMSHSNAFNNVDSHLVNMALISNCEKLYSYLDNRPNFPNDLQCTTRFNFRPNLLKILLLLNPTNEATEKGTIINLIQII